MDNVFSFQVTIDIIRNDNDLNHKVWKNVDMENMAKIERSYPSRIRFGGKIRSI